MVSTFTYDNISGSIKEDLLDVLTNLSPMETQLVSGLGTSKAESIRHEWLIDTLGSTGNNAYVEGADACYPSTTNPARLYNYTQILRRGVLISDTERAVNNAAFADRFEYEKMKKLKELKNDLERAILRGSLASGTGSAQRQMRGIKNSLSLVTSQSGVSLSEAALNDLMQLVWDNTSTTVNAVYGDMYMKRKISGFTANSTTRNVNASDRRLINAVDVYEADAAGMVKLFAHREMTISGDANYDIMGIDENMFKVAYLAGRTPQFRELAKTGDASKGEVFCEATLENLHYNAGFLSKAML